MAVRSAAADIDADDPGARRTRRLVRVADGAVSLQWLAITGISTVLVTRGYLSATGYPQVGNGTLHIAHALWGGLLMLAAIAVALVYAGADSRAWTVLLGGAGLGLFADEIGKYLTRTDDYFYRPAAAIIYLLFALLLVLASLLERGTVDDSDARLGEAAHIAATGLVSGLGAERRSRAIAALEGRADPAGLAVLRLLELAPERRPGVLRRIRRGLEARARRLADRRGAGEVVAMLLFLSHLVVAIVFLVQACLLGVGEHLAPGTEDWAVVAEAGTRGVSLLLVSVGLIRWRADRQSAYRWFRAALLVDLLITQVLNFSDSQFRAVAELPYQLVLLAFVTYWLRSAAAAGRQ